MHRILSVKLGGMCKLQMGFKELISKYYKHNKEFNNIILIYKKCSRATSLFLNA